MINSEATFMFFLDEIVEEGWYLVSFDVFEAVAI
jgi:hypothetical protein